MNAQQTLEKVAAQICLVDEAATLLGCSRVRIHQLIDERDLAHVRQGQRATFLLRSQIEQIAAEVPTETRGRKRGPSKKKKPRSKKQG